MPAIAGFVAALLLGGPARAGMKVPVPLATRVLQADAVVLGAVAAVHVQERDAVRTITLEVDVVDSLPSRPASGRLTVRVVQRGLDTSADFGSVYAVNETRLFVLDRADDGVFEQQLFVAPTLSSASPTHPHPLARGERWLVLPDWGYGGVLFPVELPLTFASEEGARRCVEGTLNTFVAWFTWEDLVALPETGLDVGLAQLAPPTPCDPRAPIPVAVGCSPERCPSSWWHHELVDCRGPAGALRLTRVAADRFAVGGRLQGRRLPTRLRAVVDEREQVLRLLADGSGGREVLRLHWPWYAVVAMVPPGGQPPPVPSLHVEASVMGRRHPEDTLSLVCTAP